MNIKSVFLIASLFFSHVLCAMEATIFRVGQGNCVFASCPGEKSLLADGGSAGLPLGAEKMPSMTSDEIRDKILKTIIEKTPKKQLAILLSHPDIDHSKWVLPIAESLLKEEFSINLLLGGGSSNYGKSFVTTLEQFENQYEDLFIYMFVAKVAEITKNTKKKTKNKPEKKEFIVQEYIDEEQEDFLPAYCTVIHAQTTCATKNKSNELSIIARLQDPESENFSILPC